MFLIPILIVAVGAFVVYKLVSRQPYAVGGTAAGGHAAVTHVSFWPTSALGLAGLATLAGGLLSVALVNVIQVPYLRWILLITAVGASAAARLGQHDRSSSVLITLVVSGLSLVALALFVVGEIVT